MLTIYNTVISKYIFYIMKMMKIPLNMLGVQNIKTLKQDEIMLLVKALRETFFSFSQ